MLKSVVFDLLQRGYVVSVIARHERSLEALEREANGSTGILEKICVDWHNTDALEKRLRDSVSSFGQISLAVVWIHSTAPDAPLIVAKYVQGDYFHVRSCAVAEPSFQEPLEIRALLHLKNINYQKIILGFIKEDASTRWLTNEEIAKVVLEAIH